jgi:hypothetical protein
MKHNIVYERGEATSVTVFHRGRIYVAAKDHPNFDAIVAALESGRPRREIIDLLDESSALARGFRAAARMVRSVVGAEEEGDAQRLTKVAGSVEIRGGGLYFDGERMHGVLADTILAYHREGNENFLPLVRFLDKVQRNPEPHSREHLYNWMRNRSFQIAEDGDIIGYKGVDRAGGGSFRSCYANGTAKVNGRWHRNKAIPHPINAVVEMPRNLVEHNPRHGCGRGLHVGTWQFARGYGGTMLEVKINPADVVSVPTDNGWAKMRVCKYMVLREVTVAAGKVLAASGSHASTNAK